MKTARPLFWLLFFPVVALCGAEPAKPSAAVKAPAPANEAAAEPEEVYIPEKPAPKPALAAVASVDPKAKAADSKGTTGSAATPKTAVMAPPPLSPRFQQVRDRIAGLFAHRNETPPNFDPRKSPFRAAGATPAAAAAATPATPLVSPLSQGVPAPSRSAAAPAVEAPPVTPPSTELALLQQAVANLKVAGTIQIGGVAHLVINQVPYKEGDVLSAKAKGQPVYLRVKNISRYSYTLSINDVELSVKY
jgi:hypothetical protein